MNNEIKLEHVFYIIAAVLFIFLVYVMAVRIQNEGVGTYFYPKDKIVKTPIDGQFKMNGQDAEIIDLTEVGGDCAKVIRLGTGFSQTTTCIEYSPEFYEKVADSNSGLSTSQKLAFNTAIMGAVL